MPASNRFAVVTTVLASAVATTGTFTVSYPSGYVQRDFTAGLAATGSYAIVNNNDKWTAADSKISLSYGSSDITVTNSSGVSWAAGSTVVLYLDIANGNDVVILTLPITSLAAIASAGDVVTNIRPGIAGTIEYAEFVVTQAVSTASKAATLNFEIGTTNCTGGTIALTSANCTPLGATVAAAAFTGNNVLTPDSQLSVEAASVTAFAEGAGYLLVRIRKTDAYA